MIPGVVDNCQVREEGWGLIDALTSVRVDSCPGALCPGRHLSEKAKIKTKDEKKNTRIKNQIPKMKIKRVKGKQKANTEIQNPILLVLLVCKNIKKVIK